MKRNLLLVIFFSAIVFAAFSQTEAPTYEPARLTLKDGTVREIVLEVVKPIDMQTGIRCFDAKLLNTGQAAASIPKEKFSPSDIKEIRMKKRLFVSRKYADLSSAGLSSFGKYYILEAPRSGKLSLFTFYTSTGKLDLLIGKEGEEKLKPVAATSLMKYIEDAEPIKEKFNNRGYGNNPKTDNALMNDNIKFIFPLVDDYNQFAALGRMLTPEEMTDRKKLNEMIAFDFFMNYELSQRNGNNAILLDYLPNRDKKDLWRVVMKSNYGHETESTDFQYNADGALTKINYQRGDKLFQYDFTYNNNRLTSVNIGGKKKIDFLYNYDTLKTVVREINGRFAEYDLMYEKDQPKAFIVLSVTDKGKRHTSSPRDYFTWNTDKKLTGWYFDVYASKDITYGPSGDIASFTTSTSSVEGKAVSWEYVMDEKNNWTERKVKETVVTRKLEYIVKRP